MAETETSPKRLEVAGFLQSFTQAAVSTGFSVMEFGQVQGHPLLAAERAAEGDALARIYVSAGIHGDEPAGSLALLGLLRQNWFDRRISWQLLPALNPGGLSRGTRETPSGHDANRDYRHGETEEIRAHLTWLREAGGTFDAAVCLHEDWESSGFYLYELNGDGLPSPSTRILHDCSPFTGIDLSPEIDGHPARFGLIRPDAAGSGGRERWPEALYLALNHTRLCLTLETPSSQALEKRVMAHAAALRSLVAQILERRVADDFAI